MTRIDTQGTRGRSDRKEPRQVGLAVALGLSVVLHLLLFLIAAWLPLTRPSAAVVAPEPSLLRFTFAPRPEAEPTLGEKRGELPFDVPETRPTPPSDPVPPGTPRLEQLALPDLPQPEPAPAKERPEPPRRESSPQKAEPDPEARDREAAVERAPGVDLAEQTSGPFRRGPPDRDLPRRDRERPAPRDLDAALREFQSAVTRARDAQQAQGARPRVFAPEPLDLPIPGSTVGLLEFESGDYDWSDYARQVHAALLRAWYRRLHLGVGDFEQWAYQTQWRLDDRNRIRFVIEGSGNVAEITLESPSSCSPLDGSALAALSDVILPPLPEDFPRDREVVHMMFIAQVDIFVMQRHRDPDGRESRARLGYMRRYLDTLRSLGLF